MPVRPTPEQWRARAKELRTLAEQIVDPPLCEMLLRSAKDEARQHPSKMKCRRDVNRASQMLGPEKASGRSLSSRSGACHGY
jgi:hypothetical protein